MALNDKGEIYVWGGHFKGKRGDDASLRPSHAKEIGNVLYHVPCLITSLTGTIISQICCGQFHSMAIDNKGLLYTWGDNSKG